ncbi:MAG: hypothetical protein CL816_08515 [Coxiellaceae bacterium]|nr:hypothetical protein [Coxiellaceae bacterium]
MIEKFDHKLSITIVICFTSSGSPIVFCHNPSLRSNHLIICFDPSETLKKVATMIDKTTKTSVTNIGC